MHSLNNYRIEWLEQSTLSSSACPVCAQPGGAPRILRAWRPDGKTAHTLARCQKCSSLFLEDAEATHYDDIETDKSMFVQHYLEAGAGPWEMFWPAASVHSPSRKTLLDVGCGFGWLVDIWAKTFDTPATGIETAFWGGLGRETLGANILDGYTFEHPELARQRFDIVYACEVIEHVPDPKAFIAELSRYVADDGVLVLTTPAAEFITAAEDSHDIVAALCPGDHLFILGVESLTTLLRNAGYTSVKVLPGRERLIAYASRTEVGKLRPATELLQLYENYLTASRKRFQPGTPLHDGILYRLTKQMQIAGRHTEALALGAELERSLPVRYASDLDNPASVIDAGSRIESWSTWGHHLPYFMGSYAYFKAESLLNQAGQIGPAQEWLVVSVILGKRGAELSSPHFGEAIQCMWRAFSLLIQIAVATKRPTDGLRFFNELCSAGTGDPPAFGGSLPPLNLLASSACALAASFCERSDSASLEAIWLGCARLTGRPDNDPASLALLTTLADRSRLPDSAAASALLEESLASQISAASGPAKATVMPAARQLLATLQARRKPAVTFSAGLGRSLHGKWS